MKNLKIYPYVVILFAVLFIQLSSSCRSVYPNQMFQNFDSTAIETKITSLTKDYLIQPGDELYIKINTRDGIGLIDQTITSGASNGQVMINQTNIFIVSNEGIVDLPIFGKLKVVGMKEIDLKAKLENMGASLYNNPYVLLRVQNRRAFLFKGTQAAVIPLNTTPTNIFEVLAKSGGLDRHMKSYDIQIIRGNLQNPKIYKVDLSTMQGIKNSELLIQSNDIVYVKERRRPVYYALSDVAPIITVPLSIVATTISTIFLIITVSK
jgi:polysaccharide export outer membrane protein